MGSVGSTEEQVTELERQLQEKEVESHCTVRQLRDKIRELEHVSAE